MIEQGYADQQAKTYAGRSLDPIARPATARDMGYIEALGGLLTEIQTRAERINTNLHAMADRLTGETPEKPVGERALSEVMCGGTLGEVGHRIQAIMQILDSAESAGRRLGKL